MKTEKINDGLDALYIYAKGEYRRGPSHVCTKEFTVTFIKKPKPAFTEIQNLPQANFVADGLPRQYNGKHAYCRIDRNIYRPTR